MTHDNDTAGQVGGEVVELSRAEAMQLLASVSYGRLVFTEHALPAIRPANHFVDSDRVIIRTRLAAELFAQTQAPNTGVVVAYQADNIDPQRKAGWNVVITGVAHTVTQPDEVSRYDRLLQPWVRPATTFLVVEPEIVSGRRLLEARAEFHDTCS